MNRLNAVHCALAAVILAAWAPAGTTTGRVVGVTDGDTVRVLTPGHQLLKVRLTEIDAPERDQPFGQKSKQMLSALVFQRHVRLVTAGEDRYGRTSARIYAGPVDVNARYGSAGRRLGLPALPDRPSHPPTRGRGLALAARSLGAPSGPDRIAVGMAAGQTHEAQTGFSFRRQMIAASLVAYRNLARGSTSAPLDFAKPVASL